MKKFIFFVAAASLAMTACNNEVLEKEQPVNNGNNVEVAFNNVTGQTKGYVESTAFVDSPYDALHAPNYEPDAQADAREMRLSAYLYPQAGVAGTYFKNYTYKRDATDSKWHNYVADTKAPIYWPMGGALDFLAISTTEDIESLIEFNEENCAAGFTLPVSAAFKQDDILFASVAGRKLNDGGSVAKPTVDMEFQHAQAWIQFQLNSDTEDIIKVKSVELLDIYEKGELNVVNNYGKALASWNFRNETRANVAMDDTYEVLAPNYLVKKAGVEGEDSDTIGYLDMLIPEQPKTSILITYTLEGLADELTFQYDLAHENWLMGKKYIYQINFGINEVTVNPSVVEFAAGSVADFDAYNGSDHMNS